MVGSYSGPYGQHARFKWVGGGGGGDPLGWGFSRNRKHVGLQHGRF